MTYSANNSDVRGYRNMTQTPSPAQVGFLLSLSLVSISALAGFDSLLY